MENVKRKRKMYIQETSPIPGSTLSLIKRRLLFPPLPTSRGVIGRASADSPSQSVGQFTERTIEENPGIFAEMVENAENTDQTNSKLLYDGSKITEDEGTLLIYGFTARHKCTKEALSDLLQLINYFLPVSTSVPNTIHNFQKHIPRDVKIVNHHFYCEKCEGYIGLLQNSKSVNCPSCQYKIERDSATKNGNFFVVFDIRSQLESILKTPKIAANVLQNIKARSSSPISCDNLTDILDGKMYKKLGLGSNNLSCTFNTDGVPVFKSSGFSIWPVILSLNELSYPLRCRNNFVGSLWFGKSKPNFECFFKPFVDMCNTLSNGSQIIWKCDNIQFKSSVYFPLLVTDAVARAPCQGINQFNGAFGCSWCLAKGASMNLEIGSKWIYPPVCVEEPRTRSNFITHLAEFSKILETIPTQKNHFGIKSASELLRLSNFDIIDGIGFDFMHAAYLGVCRTFTNAWLDSTNHNKSFYIGLRLKAINDRLKTYLVPSYFSRSVRSIDERKFWKATEWKTWMFISVLVLKDILPNPFFLHFSKFVYAIMILSAESINILDIEKAHKLLCDFTIGVQNLYGLSFCSYNCHSLLHAARCVENWGPLWGYSAFQFENYNGVLLNLFNGSRNLELQISQRICDMICCLNMSNELPLSCPIQFFLRMVKHERLRQNVTKVGSVLLFGGKTRYFFSKDEKQILSSKGIECIHGERFNSCLVNGKCYSPLNYKSTKRCDSVAEVNGEVLIIRKILLVNSTPMCVVSKIIVRVTPLNPFCHCVNKISSKIYMINTSLLKSKFICSRNDATNFEKYFENLVRLPSCVESE